MGQQLLFCDTLAPGQLLFVFAQHSVQVIHGDGRSFNVEGEAVINRFSYGALRLTMLDLVHELNLPSTLPTRQRMETFEFYDMVLHPTAQFEVDYPLSSLAPMTRLGRQKTTDIMSRWIGVENGQTLL